MAANRQQSMEQLLRAKALSAARIQFAGRSPSDLTHAAEELYQWMKHGGRAQPEPMTRQDQFNLALRALIDKGHEPWEALMMLR